MVAARWRRALDEFETTVVANADDPLVAYAAGSARHVVWVAAGSLWHEDAYHCPVCDAASASSAGRRRRRDWHCTCGFSRPEPAASVVGEDLVLADGGAAPDRALRPGAVQPGERGDGGDGGDASRRRRPRGARRRPPRDRGRRTLRRRHPPGPHAAAAARQEPRRLDGAARAGRNRTAMPLVIGINARSADGHDPSWLWDVPFERIGDRFVVATGDRRLDLAVRLRHAGARHVVEADPLRAVELAGAGPSRLHRQLHRLPGDAAAPRPPGTARRAGARRRGGPRRRRPPRPARPAAHAARRRVAPAGRRRPPRPARDLRGLRQRPRARGPGRRGGGSPSSSSRPRPTSRCRPRATSTASAGARTGRRSTPRSACAKAPSPPPSPGARPCSPSARDSRSSGRSSPEPTDATTTASACSTPRPGGRTNAAPSARSSPTPTRRRGVAGRPADAERVREPPGPHVARRRCPAVSPGSRRGRERFRRGRRRRRGQGLRHLPPRSGPRPQPGPRRPAARPGDGPHPRAPPGRRGARRCGPSGCVAGKTPLRRPRPVGAAPGRPDRP